MTKDLSVKWKKHPSAAGQWIASDVIGYADPKHVGPASIQSLLDASESAFPSELADLMNE